MHAFILADGEPISSTLVQKLRRGRFTLVLDGAAERVKKQKWFPNLILGDLDSVRPSTLQYFQRNKVKVLATPDQNFTDLEKAITWCISEQFESIWISQAVGGRLDHTLANLSFLKRFHKRGREIVLFTEKEKVRFLENQSLQLDGKKGRLFALVPFPKCTASSKGLVYEMKEMKLELGVRESVANKAKDRKVRIQVHGKALLIEGTK